MSDEIRSAAEETLRLYISSGRMVSTVESCTGGLVSGALTDIPGSSAVVERGFVTYSNDAKAELVGVDMALIKAHGAVSAEVAQAMARGGVAHSRADVAIAVTGVAGPGGSEFKPEGLVHFCVADRSGGETSCKIEFGPLGRDEVRRRSVLQALKMLREHPAEQGHPHSFSSPDLGLDHSELQTETPSKRG